MKYEWKLVEGPPVNLPTRQYSMGPGGTVYQEIQEDVSIVVAAYTYDMERAHLIRSAPELYRELSHLVRLLEPLEKEGLDIPGLATLNGAREALNRAKGIVGKEK